MIPYDIERRGGGGSKLSNSWYRYICTDHYSSSDYKIPENALEIIIYFIRLFFISYSQVLNIPYI